MKRGRTRVSYILSRAMLVYFTKFERYSNHNFRKTGTQTFQTGPSRESLKLCSRWSYTSEKTSVHFEIQILNQFYEVWGCGLLFVWAIIFSWPIQIDANRKDEKPKSQESLCVIIRKLHIVLYNYNLYLLISSIISYWCTYIYANGRAQKSKSKES